MIEIGGGSAGAESNVGARSVPGSTLVDTASDLAFGGVRTAGGAARETADKRVASILRAD